MEIAVFLSGTINNGLDSPTPGEGRWGQNISKLLAMNGHNVDCYTSGPCSWGSSQRYHNVNLSPFLNISKEYDLVLYMPWEHQYRLGSSHPHEPCLTIPLKSKWYIHFTFSWAASIPGDHTCYNNNHALAYPYIQEDHQFPPYGKENPYKTFPLPIPLYTDLAPINLKNRKNIIWSTKDVFHPGWGNIEHHVPAIGMRTLRSIKKLAEKHSFETHFLSTTYFNPEISHLSKELGVREFVESIPNARFYNLIPRTDLMNIMNSCRITTIVSGLLGSFGDSIVMGSVPLCYSGHIYRESAKRHGLLLPVFDATEEQIYDCVERLYTDDFLFINVITDYRHELRYHSYEMSYEYFRKMVKELFGSDYKGV